MKQIILLIFIIMGTSKLDAQTKISAKQAANQRDYFKSKVHIPHGYVTVDIFQVRVNNTDAYLFRYQKEKEIKQGGEHFSFIVSKDLPYSILGFTHMDGRYIGADMISGTRTAEIALQFLKNIDSTLASELSNLWIEQHDEAIVKDGMEMTVSGMKYKCYRKSTDDYTWVNVGNDGSIVTFERDIIWQNEMQQRVTEKWLHDVWLKEQFDN